MPMWEYPHPTDQALPVPRVKCDSSMPYSYRDVEQPRRRRRDHEAERDPATSRDKQRSSTTLSSGKLHYKRRSSSRDRERGRDSPRSTTSDRGSRKVSGVPEMERRASGGDAKPKSSYPTFSKAHSREAVGSREDVVNAKSSPYTPEATEVGQEKERRRNSTPANGVAPMPSRIPPSPPLTAENPEMRRSGSGGSMRRVADKVKSEMENGRKSTEGTPESFTAQAAKSSSSLRKEARFADSEISSMPGAFPEDERVSTPNSGYRRTVSTGSQQNSTVTQNTQNTQDTQDSEGTEGTGTDSDATSIAPERKGNRPRHVSIAEDDSSSSFSDLQPKTPVAPKQSFPLRSKTPVIDVGGANAYTPSSLNPKTPLTALPPPPPPPPPPPGPDSGEQTAPKVDYLLKHGGLTYPISRRLVQTGPAVQQHSMYSSPAIGQMVPIEEYAKVFSSLHRKLDEYLQVLRGNGSLAVATGYKSVARRLLDKLSQVFARDISSQRCDCVVCKTTSQPILSDEEDSGVSWGEILEFVAGRRELPQWPPFSIQPDDSGLGITGATQAPMQKLDIDVPEEYREHYIHQNQKTKKAVQSWLMQQPVFPSSPPDEADEDTLMFAMMTKLNAEQRNLFIALMHGQNFVSPSRAPTPAERPATSSNALKRARQALQRLYRLARAPRDCECAMYLLNNPHLHGMLATLAEVNEQEWDILVSGRFDGFLWSGADAPFPPSASAYNSPVQSRGPSRGPNATPFSPLSRNTTPFSGFSAVQSRGPTPFHPLRNAMSPDGTPQGQQLPAMFPSRGPTPALNGMGVTAPAPVQMDEDTEIAVLNEVERNLFNDMERFEDAFEVLHSRAELVRQLLRERATGLSMRAQVRRGSGTEDMVRLDTPATDFESEVDDDDDGLADMASLAPDDSASQISTNRRQRKRHERRTPAPLPEEDESMIEEQQQLPHRHGGRRSKY